MFFLAIYIYIYIYISLYNYIYLHIYIYISVYIYISIKFYIYLYIDIEKKNATFYVFAKERNVLCIILCSLQKNIAFFAFFYILKKRTQKNASFFWVS